MHVCVCVQGFWSILRYTGLHYCPFLYHSIYSYKYEKATGGVGERKREKENNVQLAV